MKLSKNFTLEELIRSDTAERLGIDNVPKDEKVIENLRNLCFEVLQPLRDYVILCGKLGRRSIHTACESDFSDVQFVFQQVIYNLNHTF